MADPVKYDFQLVTECSFGASAKAVWDVTVDVKAYPQWWRCIHNVEILSGEERLQQQAIIEYTLKGFLPHKLRFRTFITECVPLSTIVMKVNGDLEGTGISTLEEQNGTTLAKFHWNVSLTHPVLRRLGRSRLGHKILVMNHGFAMQRAVTNMRRRVHAAAA
ncbi:MAG: hypothetical protein JXQ81_11330 [Desulfuromonadales bacterium]|nr:hypothetical protein [Desulfuromonadales bacterium]MBN2793090.1 hypothetical protein [Desulfuromonadales bacterium]